MPGAPRLKGASVREFAVDYQHGPSFRDFVDGVLRRIAPVAVLSLTELGLEPAAAAARRLGAVGVAPEAVRDTRDKVRMRRALERTAPQLNPPFAAGDDERGLVERVFGDGCAVVAKPAGGTGSHGVRLLREMAELGEELRCPGVVLERYVEGREFSVEALSSGGRHRIMGVAEKRVGPGGFVEVAHVMPPPELEAGAEGRVVGAVEELLDAVGLADGPSHTEVKLGGDGRVTVIETHTRPGGDGIPDLVRLTTGVDWRRAALGWALGEEPRRGEPAAKAAASVFLTAPPGRVALVHPAPAPPHVDLAAWEVYVEPGDPVQPLRSSADRLGMALLTSGDGPAACAAAVDGLLARPVVVTEPEP
ncbi:ATP-grasp domain-containing protein [Streptomyces sp. MUM 203J]|nr:ATP-grasp domain-containing protein [Streptomyces sp. MUM 203J]